jgi:DNA polymerase-3 subunit beta
VKFTCTKKALSEALHSVSRAVANKSTLPILSNVLLEVKEGMLKLVTTDLEMGLTCSIPLDRFEEGAVTVPEKILQDVVGGLGDTNDVTVSDDERSMLTVTAGKSRYTIHGLPATDYPLLPQVNSNISIKVKSGDFKDLIKKVIFAVSTDEGRAVLTGCFLNWDGVMLTAVATDTHRLAAKRVTANGEMVEAVSIVVPERSMNELMRLLNVGDEYVEIHISENQVKFVFAHISMVSRLIEGTFPPFERVIPAQTDLTKRLVINREELLDAVRRANVVASKENNKIVIKAEENKLSITARTGDIGEANEEIDVLLEGDPIEIGFNADFLRDVLQVLTCDTVELGLSAPLSPGLLRSVDESEFNYVVMPMQI